MERLATSQEDKPLHAMYHHQTEDMADIRESYQWLVKLGLNDSTETRIETAQERQETAATTSGDIQAAGCSSRDKFNTNQGEIQLREWKD